jgi:hypothetical protein
VLWSVVVFRAALFAAAVAFVGWLLRVVHLGLGRPIADSDAVWIVPAAVFAATLYKYSKRWTGGPSFRRAVRADVARGEAAVHRIVAVDAIEVAEQEDEGPSYFVLTDDGTTMLFAGQYLDAYKRKGFPWKTFEILEAPESKIFFGLVPVGEKLTPSATRPPFSWQEYKDFAHGKREWAVLQVDFASLKQAVTAELAEPAR